MGYIYRGVGGRGTGGTAPCEDFFMEVGRSIFYSPIF